MVRIKLSNKLYRKKAVIKALNDFKEIMDGRILNEDMDIEVLPKEQIENLDKEFCNYVLGLMKG